MRRTHTVTLNFEHPVLAYRKHQTLRTCRLIGKFVCLFGYYLLGVLRSYTSLWKRRSEGHMLSGHQSYSISLTGYYYLSLPPFDVTATEFPAVDRIEISSPNEKQVLVTISFKQIATPEDADSIGRVIAAQVADRLAFEYKLSAGDPVKADGSFEERDASGAILLFASNHVNLSTSGCITHKAAVTDVPKLKLAIEASEPKKDTYYTQFRWIMCQDDPVTRFMHLYKILLSLEGGQFNSQKPVDAFIVGQEPMVQQVFNPHSKVNRNETIYTRFRNEVGHEIVGTTPASTRQGMEQHVDKLADHVKVAIAKIR